MVSAHREENISSEETLQPYAGLNDIAENYNYPIIVCTHPRTRNMINEEKIKMHKIYNF